MTYYAKPNYIQYDEWFDNNIDPMDLEYEKEKKFSNYVHDKFYEISSYNLIIGGSEVIEELNKTFKCSDDFCPLTDEELNQI
tara:strand:+ start:10313 stop:10558 length:246 start_codon:yes stop_codon:yes gene_type:complete